MGLAEIRGENGAGWGVPAKIFLRAFLCGICCIPPTEVDVDEHLDKDWSEMIGTNYKNARYYTRVEFTETRGVQHLHSLAKSGIVWTVLIGHEKCFPLHML